MNKKHELCQKKMQKSSSCVSFYLVPLLYFLLRDYSALNCLLGMTKWKKRGKKTQKQQCIDPWGEGKPQQEEGGNSK